LVRAGRFSRVAHSDQEPLQPLTVQQLLVIDLMPPQSLGDARIAQDRIRTIAHSAAFLLVSHLVTATLILFAVIEQAAFSLENWPLLVSVFALLWDSGSRSAISVCESSNRDSSSDWRQAIAASRQCSLPA
jgi:hypothetical protein